METSLTESVKNGKYFRFAILYNSTVEDIILANSAEPLHLFYPNREFVRLDENDHQTIIGSYFLKFINKFMHPKPFNSWIFDIPTSTWKPPVPHPNSNSPHVWDESQKQWIKIEID
jgi:hypothetical protein